MSRFVPFRERTSRPSTRLSRGTRVLAAALGLVSSCALAQSIDPAFQPQPDSEVWMVANHPDGGVLTGGFFRQIDGPSHPGFTWLDNAGHIAAGFPDIVFHDSAWSVSLLPDGRMLVGGMLQKINGPLRGGVARLHADGTLDDSFGDPMVGGRVNATAVLPDGKILVAGHFGTVAGLARGNIARLNDDGTIDTTFAAHADSWVEALAVQTDGKILIGGYFSQINGQPRAELARLNADGSLDASFAPALNHHVSAIALQPDGRILVGGDFTFIGGVRRQHLARLLVNGALDASFADPGLQSWTDSMVLQADGKLLVGGAFNSVAGVARASLARINADGSLDASFADLGGDAYINALTLQPGGHLVVGGRFNQIGGFTYKNLARVMLTEPASESLQVEAAGSRVTWLRAGSSPELGAPPIVYRSTNGGATWSALGTMARVEGGWRVTGIPVLIGKDYKLRVDGVVGMQALMMGGAQPEVGNALIGIECLADAARGILAEHQVLAVAERKCLLVLALDGGLYRRLQGLFDQVDEVRGGKVEARREFDPHPRGAALAVRRGKDAFFAAKPGQHLVALDIGGREIEREALLDELARQRRRGRTGAGVLHLEGQLGLEIAALHAAGDLDRIRAPAAVGAGQRRTSQQLVEADRHQRLAGEIGVGFEEIPQHAAQRGRSERLSREMAIGVQVEARHVDAAAIITGEVHERGDTRADPLHLAVRASQEDRHLDAGHADAVERTHAVRMRLDGDVRHHAPALVIAA